MCIKIKNLTKSYDGIKVLDDISLTLKKDRPICIMAPSGRGKTTLIYILMGLLKSDSGSVEGLENKKISAVFQEERLCEELSAIMNVAIIRNLSDKDYIISNLLKLGIPEEDLHRPVNKLSGGQRQRVSILRAIYSDSDIIFMDEAFKGLDENTKKETIKYVLENLNGRMLVAVTHSKEEAELLGAEIINL